MCVLLDASVLYSHHQYNMCVNTRDYLHVHVPSLHPLHPTLPSSLLLSLSFLPSLHPLPSPLPPPLLHRPFVLTGRRSRQSTRLTLGRWRKTTLLSCKISVSDFARCINILLYNEVSSFRDVIIHLYITHGVQASIEL